MSVYKLRMILFSGSLICATASVGSAQSYNQDTPKQTQIQKGTETEKKTTAQNARTATGKTRTRLSNSKVRQTQTALKKEGFDPGPVDGILGLMTMTALRNYQSHNGLEVTGTVNAETKNALMGGASARNTKDQNQDRAAEYQPDLSQNRLPAAPAAPEPGVEGAVSNLEDVRQVQQALADLKYNPGDVNGMMSSETQQAIREFQQSNHLPVTGNIDEQTRIAIDSQWRGGVQTAQQSTTPSSSDTEREKPGTSSNEPKTDDAKTDVKTKHKDQKVDSKPDKDVSERVSKAAAVLQDLTASADKRIPDRLLEHAEAIAVIPNMIKGAFGIGGRFGKGLVSQRSATGRWSAPAFIEVGGGSFGAQIGVSSTDLVLVFTDGKGLNLLEGGKDLKLGVDAGVVAGPVGRSAEAGVNANLESAIYAYSRSKGLFAGIALDGAVLSMDKDTNQKVYGASSDAKQILDGNVSTNPTVKPFMAALDKVVPKKRQSQK